MATLSTGQQQLQQVERRRAIANAMQAQALSFAPIQSPYQGLAQLAQAWIGGKMNRRADADEEKIRRQQNEALAQVLAPNVSFDELSAGVDITNKQPGSPAALQQLQQGSGSPIPGPDNQDEVAAYDQLVREAQGSTTTAFTTDPILERVETPKTGNQLLQSLAQARPDMMEGILGQVVGQQVLADRGLTPGLLPEPEPTTEDITEWRLAVKQGYPGGLQDWKDRNLNVGPDRGTDGAPSGYRWTKEGNLEIIEGGPADRNTPEAATKATLVERARWAARELTGIIYETDDDGVILTDDDGLPEIHRRNIANMSAKTYFSRGRTGNVLLKEAIEAKLRAESGAAVPTTEVERAAERFAPSVFDLPETIRLKQRLLQRFLDDAYNRMNSDGRFDVTGTINTMLDAAEQEGITGQSSAIEIGTIRYNRQGEAVQIVNGPNGVPMWIPYSGEAT